MWAVPIIFSNIASRRMSRFAQMLSTSTLSYIPSSHNSITIDLIDFKELENNETSQDINNLQFSELLSNTIDKATNEKKSACWLKLPIEYGYYIPLAAKLGFKFHHAEDNQATMSLWLDPSHTSRIPKYATHQIGVGGLVVNGYNSKTGEPDKILVIKEINKVNNNYKFPGGLSDVGEHFSDTAIREVKEETGIESKFISLLTMRHSHEVQFGVSDIYLIALLEAKTTEIVKCNLEIEEAIWIDYQEFKLLNQHPMFEAAINVISKKGLPLIEEEYPNIRKGKPPYKLYHAPIVNK